MSTHVKVKLFQAETIISHVLRVGVWIAAFFLSTGLLVSWVHPHPTGFSTTDLSTLVAGQTITNINQFHSFGELLGQFLFFDPGAIISVGVMVLIALPILRVALTVILFLLERDYLYFFITGFVLLVLISGILLGRAI